MSTRVTTILLLAIVMTAAACNSGSEPSSSPSAPSSGSASTSDGSEPAAQVSVPDGWTTHTGNGFEISTPADWQTTDQRGEWGFNVQAGSEPLSPWVSVEAAPSAGVGASERLDAITGPIALTSEDFEVVGEEEQTWPTAPQGMRREVTYVGAGPDGEDLDIHEYLVVALGDGIDVHVRAATLDDEFADASQTLRDIIATLVVRPDTFEASPSEDATA